MFCWAAFRSSSALGIGGAKLERYRARRVRRQKQRNDDCSGPRKVGLGLYTGNFVPL
jgi:hypothetical protein